MSGLTRDGRQPNLTRETKLSGANGDREYSIFPTVQLTTSRIRYHTRLMPSLLKVMTTHTHTHTVRDNERCNDSVEEVDGIEVGSRKRKRRDSVSPSSRLI